MAHTITVALSGLGGYGEQYLNDLLDPRYRDRITLAGGIDPAPERCSRLADLRALGVPLYDSLDAFYRKHQSELLIVSAPIHEHARQTCLGLAHGSHILCEKPLAATVQEADEMIAARNRAGKVVAIGYQWSFDPAILRLKRDVMAGKYGRPRRLRALVLWPRSHTYYARNTWAGRQRTADGAWVLDSPVNNAAAHYLHNMLFLLGDRLDRSATPRSVQAELYRANAIDNYDTAALRVRVEGDAEILFYTSHAVTETVGPILHIEFERGQVDMGGQVHPLIAQSSDGKRTDYGVPDNGVSHKLASMLDAIEHGTPVPCGIETARAHTVCMNAAQDSAAGITPFDPSLVEEVTWPDGPLTCVKGLGEELQRCAMAGQLPAEMGLPWARAAQPVDVRA